DVGGAPRPARSAAGVRGGPPRNRSPRRESCGPRTGLAPLVQGRRSGLRAFPRAPGTARARPPRLRGRAPLLGGPTAGQAGGDRPGRGGVLPRSARVVPDRPPVDPAAGGRS